ncbi:hypothetical protein [Natrarchaeobaculum aegyptiacum]|uniref:Cytochrome oxidase n=1 Tax=Natrarchaeobaculum aegyptiacum TaxID=745377 RepID=A0A2Z2HT99_9EURY|nr:hypothetical protein [Natrarchaeobaculum aegyptiacum]ARS89345.1 hypothetical protein B1756_06015 [Natrarchaeobaculum aegyptiacum]
MSSATEQRDAGGGRTDQPVREIGHDEYDPIGTLTLILGYFVLLLLLWIFMYFVEFLGNDPTVIGTLATGVGLA